MNNNTRESALAVAIGLALSSNALIEMSVALVSVNRSAACPGAFEVPAGFKTITQQ